MSFCMKEEDRKCSKSLHIGLLKKASPPQVSVKNAKVRPKVAHFYFSLDLFAIFSPFFA